MLVSTAMPYATLNTNTVDGFKGMSKYPIMPAVMIKGTVFGIKQTKSIFPDLNIHAIIPAIIKNANTRL